MQRRAPEGFTLIELMIVVAIIAIIASIAIPSLLSAKVAANQNNAVTTLRNLATAQSMFQTLAAVDADSDGAGEYGTFAEMSGAIALNTRGGAGAATPLNPAILSAPFEQVDAQGRTSKSGYYFRMFLPDRNLLGVAELAGGGPAVGLDPDACEYSWSCYAWPVNAGTTGSVAYFVDYRGEILMTRMNAAVYSGAAGPAFAAALSGPTMTAEPGIHNNANDGNPWAPLK